MSNLLVVNLSDPGSVEEAVQMAAQAIAHGKVVALPTDSVYGLACDPWNRAAVANLFQVKHRPERKPVLLLVDSLARLKALAREVPQFFDRLAEKFSPGPLTYVVPAARSLPSELTGGTGKIGLRLPAFEFARRLAAECDGAITATSANLSEQPAATSGRAVLDRFGDIVDLIIDGGESSTKTVSTVVDLTTDPPTIVREGAISAAAIRKALREE